MISQDDYKKVEEVMIDYLNHKPLKNPKEALKIFKLSRQFAKDMFESVKKGNYEMAYQPKMNPDGKTVNNAEALFRGKEEYRVNPEVVFVLFKIFKHEKEVLLDYQIPKICKDTAKLVNTFGSDFSVSINVASEQLNEEFYNKLKTELDKNLLDFSNIEIEFLESESFENMDKIPMIEKLKSEGVKFALDDYGSRNANKHALHSMDFDVVKIDKSIIKTANATNNYSEVKHIVDIARKKNPKVQIVAEGIENDNEIENLKKIGDIQYQGWRFSPAVSPEELINRFEPKQLGE